MFKLTLNFAACSLYYAIVDITTICLSRNHRAHSHPPNYLHGSTPNKAIVPFKEISCPVHKRMQDTYTYIYRNKRFMS